MMKHISCIFVLCVLLQLSRQSDASEEFLKCFPNNKLSATDPQSISAKLAKSRLQFSIDFTKNVLKRSKAGANVFFSPHSIYQALMLALFISSNHTENSLKTVLRLPADIDKLDVLQSFRMESEFEKMRSLNASVSYELNNANRFFYQKTTPVRECMKSLFKDELYGLDFKNDAANSKKFIDDWVSNQTRYQINDLLANADIPEDTKLILVNAMYFKGLWQSKFLKENTKKEVFFISPSKNTLVPMMKQKGTFKYLISEKMGAHVIELPYKGDDISMYILLPSFYDPNGVKYLLEKMTADMISELVDPNFMVERPVELAIPKFTVEQTLSDLVPILESMGVGDLFHNSSDLSALTGDADISFNDAIHKAKVSIDEEGTVAAASTAIFTFRSSRPLDPIKFTCNHPFIYFLYDHVSQTILFIGLYSTPA
jgi:serine protease inhibitor